MNLQNHRHPTLNLRRAEPQVHDLALLNLSSSSPGPPCGAPGMPCTLQDLWIINFVFSPSSLLIIADMWLVFLRTTRAGPATTLNPKGNVCEDLPQAVVARVSSDPSILSNGITRDETNTNRQRKYKMGLKYLKIRKHSRNHEGMSKGQRSQSEGLSLDKSGILWASI